MGVVAQRFDVFLVDLDPTVGGEIRKTRPCVVITPDEMNEPLTTVIVAPMTTSGHAYSFRIPCEFDGKRGFVVLDQVRTVDRARLVKHLGALQASECKGVLNALQAMFAP